MKRRLYGNMKRLTTIFCICIAVLTVLILVLRLSIFSDMVSEPEAQMETVTGNNLSYSLNREIYFANAGAQGNVLITSEESNNCYMTVLIRDPDGVNTLIHTPLMEPGDVIASLPLDLAINQGVYQCTAEISAYDLGTQEFLSRETKDVTLYVGVHPGADQEESQA